MLVGVNGLGRIGRVLLRELLKLECDIHLNSPADKKTLAHLIKYDSIYGQYDGEVRFTDRAIVFNDREVFVTHCMLPSEIDWNDAEIVIECSGKFKSKHQVLQHKANRVIVTYPMNDADITFIAGVTRDITNQDKIISIGSCTTNAFLPLLHELDKEFVISSGFLTTVHSYTSDQNLMDNSHADLRRARGACSSIIPTKTGINETLKVLMPHLSDKIAASALRVPVSCVSLLDFTFTSEKTITTDILHQLFCKSEHIITNTEPLVSVDYKGCRHSTVVDLLETRAITHHSARILSWYDNEYGFVCRIIDILKRYIKI